MIIEVLFPRLIFNLTLAFRALTEKQAGRKTSGTDAVQPQARGLVLPQGTWAWGLGGVSSESPTPCCSGQGSTASSITINSKPPRASLPCLARGWVRRHREENGRVLCYRGAPGRDLGVNATHSAQLDAGKLVHSLFQFFIHKMDIGILLFLPLSNAGSLNRECALIRKIAMQMQKSSSLFSAALQ